MIWLERVALFASALIHLVPLSGVLGARSLERLYGVTLTGDPLILMQHRAVLFAIVAGISVLGLVRDSDRTLALVVAVVSTGSFLVLCPRQRLARIFWADAVVFLLVLPALVRRLWTIGVSTSP